MEHDALDLPRMKRNVAWIARLIDQMIGRAIWEGEHISFRDENSDEVPTDEDMRMIVADVGLVGLLSGKLSSSLVRNIERIRSDYELHAKRWQEDE